MRINLYLLFSLLFAYCGNGQPAPRKTDASALDQKVDTLAKAYLSKGNTVSIAIGVLDKGKKHVYGFGETALGNKKLPDGNTLYEIGSITKTFTGILLAYFAAQDKLQLDDPINKYLPDSIPAHLSNITLASLSNHSSGLPRLPSNFWQGANMQNPYIHYDNQRLFSFLKNFQPTREPGAEFEYSNLAVGLLGVILERVSGKPYEQLLQEIIWQPLTMNNTRINLLAADSSLFAQGHMQGRPVHSWEFISLAAAGGIRSSINDMLKYAEAQISGGNSALQKAVQLSHQQTWQKNTVRIGLGWFLMSKDGKSYFNHNGQTGGYATALVVNPESGRAVIVLTNATVDPMATAIDLITWLDK